jgi:hypothetical protein
MEDREVVARDPEPARGRAVALIERFDASNEPKNGG